MTDIIEKTSERLSWRIHTPNLLDEILNANPTAWALEKPIQILGRKLSELGELALKIDDPRLHLMMMDLTIYSQADPELTSQHDINKTRESLKKVVSEIPNA